MRVIPTRLGRGHKSTALLLSYLRFVENRVGVEPTTLGLRGPRSTAELPVQTELTCLGEPSEIRTHDARIKSPPL